MRRACGLFTAALLAAAPFAAHAQAANAPAVPRVELDKLKRSGGARPSNDLFGARSWETRAPERKVAPPPPAPPPQAPPVPFAYVGRWIEKGETIAVLSRANQNYIVRAGEKIDAAYLLETIENDKVIVRYLPLDVAQVLPFASGAAANTVRREQPLDNRVRRQLPRDTDDEED
jgi:hypothetical protein